ncbi:MAG: hypothetical protein AAGU21_20270 [Solidesulfovibrio sp.]|uniref:hypothetical protein n=1 Tax=Solidesulfovibrio sp. TaxID=2910990 RepID=UPI002B219A25|nr:hypothetical protein [Solidesulfovibrio sp.]MEA4857945.1 hypothetical protein [Solidesulfovibrio sp.]
MYLYQNTQQYPTPQRLTTLPAGAIATMGLVGALLGGVVTAARDMRDVRAGTMERGEMLGDVVKESLGTGLATAVGTAAGGMVFRNGALALATMAVVGIGTKYLYDGMASAACEAKKTAEAPVKATNKKA